MSRGHKVVDHDPCGNDLLSQHSYLRKVLPITAHRIAAHDPTVARDNRCRLQRF